ncbi:MAG: hypothetical protein M3Q06_00320, partial [Bacteroidota bacterium]|nr:hypothetical protein [Bacteroidota bacterium]
LQPWLNSYSTNLKAAAGGWKGRALLRDDEIAFAPINLQTDNAYTLLPWTYNAVQNQNKQIAIITGPEWDWITQKSQQELLNSLFTITPASDRMGYRLQGEKIVQGRNEQLLSSGVGFGTVQLLPNGQLIILMADHQTTGGYPRVANIITAHLPLLAQKSAGDAIQFALTSVTAAEAKGVAQQKLLSDLQNTCKLKLQNWMHAH